MVVSEKSSQAQGTPSLLDSLRRAKIDIYPVMGMTLFAKSRYYYYLFPPLCCFFFNAKNDAKLEELQVEVYNCEGCKTLYTDIHAGIEYWMEALF